MLVQVFHQYLPKVVPKRPYKNIWMSISHDHLKSSSTTGICNTICVKFWLNTLSIVNIVHIQGAQSNNINYKCQSNI